MKPFLYIALAALSITILSCGVDTSTTASQPYVSHVMDQANLLTSADEDTIALVAARLRADVGSELAVLIVDSLGSKTIEAFSLAVADSLGLGRASHHDGLLITVALADRKVRIEVGTGLENIVRDEIAAAIIAEDMAPRFRENDYAGGIYAAVANISKLIRENEKLVGTKPE